MSRFPQIPDVSFMGNITVAELKELAIDEHKAAVMDISGKYDGISDEDKAILYTAAQIFYQSAEAIDKKARQNLLKYAEGEYLENLAAGKPLTRKLEEYAIVTIRFTLAAARQSTVAIPVGTRVTSSATKIYFATTEYGEIAPGEMYVDIQCISMTGGAAANDFEIGELNILVDPIAYIASVSNTDKPSGGADEESDDDFAERIYLARNLYSTAGSEGAYIYYTKSYSTLIDDVVPKNPKDAEIVIYITLKNGELATESFLEGCRDFLYTKTIKPLTDKITVKNVERISYSINVEYTIYEDDLPRLTEIENAVSEAVEEYKQWQCAKIGRDINNQELITRMKNAGAAKVNITLPQDTTVSEEQIAFCTGTTVTYKGYVEE